VLTLAAVREVTALVEVETHEGVAGLQHSEQHSLIGLCTGVRLNVGILSAEELLDALDGEVLYLVYHLATAIVTLAGQTLGILVGEVTAHRLPSPRRSRSSLKRSAPYPELALMLLLDEVENLLVFFH
jgi:hypothetical protein